MLTIENFGVTTILCSAKKSSALSSWLRKKSAANDLSRGLKPLQKQGRKTMSKTKTAKKSSGTAKKKSAALNHNPATMFDIGQFFNTGKTEKFMSQGKNQFDKLTNDASAFGREGYEAFNKSMSIFAKGFEEIVRASMSIAQSSAEKQGQLVKEALSTKSLNEWADIQNRIAQTSFDDVIAAATKLSEMSVKVLTQGSEPINSSFTKGMKKATEAKAA